MGRCSAVAITAAVAVGRSQGRSSHERAQVHHLIAGLTKRSPGGLPRGYFACFALSFTPGLIAVRELDARYGSG